MLQLALSAPGIDADIYSCDIFGPILRPQLEIEQRTAGVAHLAGPAQGRLGLTASSIVAGVANIDREIGQEF